MDWRRLSLLLGLNAFVSACVTLSVLYVWDRTHPRPASPAAPGDSAAAGQPGAPASSAATLTPAVYIVKAGDTLGRIADRYDVSIEALMAVNGLTDPNVLSVGQALVIPNAEMLLPTASPPPPTNSSAPLPTGARVSGASAQLAVREIVSPGEILNEKVVIVNLAGDVDLAGWTLREAQGQVFTFPALVLHEGGAVAVHTAPGQATVIDLYWGLSEPAWQSGEQVVLADPSGAPHTTFTVP